MAKKPVKMDKIDHVSVRDFASVRFTKCVITFAFVNFLHELFRINVTLNFFLVLLLGFFILVSRKNLAVNFQNFPRNFWNLAAEIKNPNIIVTQGINLNLHWFWKFHEKNEKCNCKSYYPFWFSEANWRKKPEMRYGQFNMKQAMNHRRNVIHWYEWSWFHSIWPRGYTLIQPPPHTVINHSITAFSKLQNKYTHERTYYAKFRRCRLRSDSQRFCISGYRWTLLWYKFYSAIFKKF